MAEPFYPGRKSWMFFVTTADQLKDEMAGEMEKGRHHGCFRRRNQHWDFARVSYRSDSVVEPPSLAGVGNHSRHLRVVLRDLLRTHPYTLTR